MADRKKSSITFKIQDNRVHATLFLTNKDLEKSGISPDTKMGTSYGLSWFRASRTLPDTMRTSGPWKAEDGVHWVHTAKFNNTLSYDILETDNTVYPVSISRDKTVDVDYQKWMEEDPRPKKLYRYSGVERMVCEGYVWARSPKQARLLARDFITGICEYQDKEMPVEEWDSEGVDISVRDERGEPEEGVPVIGTP